MKSLLRRNLPEGVHKPCIQLIDPCPVSVADFDDTLDMSQVTKLQARPIVEPTGWREEDEGQDQNNDDVILPASSLVGPEDRPLCDQYNLGPQAGICATLCPVSWAGSGWFAEFDAWRHTPASEQNNSK